MAFPDTACKDIVPHHAHVCTVVLTLICRLYVRAGVAFEKEIMSNSLSEYPLINLYSAA